MSRIVFDQICIFIHIKKSISLIFSNLFTNLFKQHKISMKNIPLCLILFEVNDEYLDRFFHKGSNVELNKETGQMIEGQIKS